MNTFFTTHSTKIRGAVVLLALASSGLFSSVQAQPRTQGQYGWPNNNNNGRRGNNDPWNEREVLSGEVVKRYSNTEYDLRAGDGHVFRVRLDDSLSLDRGDDVRVSGDWRGSTFYARNVTLVDRDNGYGNWGDRGDWNNGFRSRIDITGLVVRRYGNQVAEVRTWTGRTYLVRLDNSSTYFREGDRIRISGLSNGNRIRATQVSNLTRNGGVVPPNWDNRYPNGSGGWNNGNNNGGVE